MCDFVNKRSMWIEWVHYIIKFLIAFIYYVYAIYPTYWYNVQSHIILFCCQCIQRKYPSINDEARPQERHNYHIVISER
jgi:hypothetical protein